MRESDKIEVIDLVKRKEPISLDGIMRQTAVYSRDETFTALKWGEREGIVERREGDLEEDGTTADVWESVDE